ncbi:hypothetical protein MTO96_027682 [Rhipicephalus appendiculatus]
MQSSLDGIQEANILLDPGHNENYQPSWNSFADMDTSESLGLDAELPSALAEGPSHSFDLPQLPTEGSNCMSAAAAVPCASFMDSASPSALCSERKFIIFESCLRQLLLKSCPMCGRPWSSSLTTVGTMLSVKSCCDHCANEAAWQSQPFAGAKPAENGLLAAALLFTGCSVAKTLRFLKAMNVQGISRHTYFRYQTCYLVPAHYKEQQAGLVSSVAGVEVDLTGNARCDSPGHSAKYGTYVVLGAQMQRVRHCESVHVRESAAVPHSNAMKKEGLVRSLHKLEDLGVKVRSVTTERHPAVRSYFRKERPDCQHYFDSWRVAKGFQKKLVAASKARNSVIRLWIRSIVKHLYFVAAAGEGDWNLMVSMWRSLLNHICNKHTNHEGPFTDCLHEPLVGKAWMTRGLGWLCCILMRTPKENKPITIVEGSAGKED